MKRNLILVLMLSFALVLTSLSNLSAASRVPLAFLFQVEGKVEYSKNGKKWKKVRRNKFLFKGYLVRSTNGSVMIMDKRTNQSQKIAANTEVKVTADGIEVIKGSLGEASSSNLLAGLEQRFKKSQKYTTVRRSHKKNQGLKLSTAQKISLMAEYPEIVWQNVGEKYSYRVHIDNESIDIPATEDGVVRAMIPVLDTKGTSEYFVEIMQDGEPVYTPEKKGTINWIKGEAKEKFFQELKVIESIDSEGFLKGNFLKDNQLYVAAMDSYKNFFSANEDDPDINHMRPVLVEVYKRLQLKEMQNEEYTLYNEILLEEE